MQDQVDATTAPKRVPWNKGKLTGAKPPLRPKHVWSIRTKLQIEGRARDLAMFNLAIDSKFSHLPCTVAGSTLRILDGYGLRGKWPARPTLAPCTRFLSIDSHVCSTLPSDLASRRYSFCPFAGKIPCYRPKIPCSSKYFPC